MAKKTTIYDIAKKLNITAATVSRALNNSSNISKSTRELVVMTASKMNYEQNKLALALKSGKSHNVGILVPRVDSNFFGSIIRGVEEELYPHGYQVIICQTHGDEQRESKNIETLLNAQVDGILMSSGSAKTNIFDRILKENVPLIFFDRFISMNGVSAVIINDFEAGYKATIHLIEQGCKQIGYFSGDRTLNIYKERFSGYKKALEDSGIVFNENHVVQTLSNPEDGKRAMKFLLDLKNPPDALFSSSDFAALGAIKELQERNYKIPHDFAVVGFSNEPFTKFMELSISTVDQSPMLMGKMAAQVFLEQINDNSIKIEKKVVLEPQLIIRQSSQKSQNENTK